MQLYFFIPCKFRPNYNLCFKFCILPHLHIWTEAQLVQYKLVGVLAVARTCIYRVDFPSSSACRAPLPPARRNQPAGGFTANCSTSIIRIPTSNYCTIHFFVCTDSPLRCGSLVSRMGTILGFIRPRRSPPGFWLQFSAHVYFTLTKALTKLTKKLIDTFRLHEPEDPDDVPLRERKCYNHVSVQRFCNSEWQTH